MYLEFFKLKQLPFRLTADPRFHFENGQRTDAKKHLLAALTGPAPAEGDGCTWVSGDAGMGKTILVQDTLAQLQNKFIVVQIRQPEISVAEFHEAIVAELDGGLPAARHPGAAANLNASLERQAGLGRRVVLFLDNGEVLTEDLLDEILRLPWRSEAAQRSLRVVLAARPSLGSILHKPRFEGRSSRLGLHIELAPLSAAESQGYIEHRLAVAGRAGGGIFGHDALEEIQRFTGGVPRLINTLADAALMAAFNRDHNSVSAFEIRNAAKQLQWVEYEARVDRGAHAPTEAEEGSIGHVRIEHENMVVADFDLPLGKISLGRSPNNDVKIESRFVSRNHCQVVTTAHYSVIEDLQSQNGLTVGSRRVSVHRLQHGDRVQMGEHILVYTRLPLRGRPNISAFPMRLGGPSGVVDTGQTGLIASVPEANGGGPTDE
jgi:general secretion pathway protein A